jgi:hypothetical protein
LLEKTLLESISRRPPASMLVVQAARLLAELCCLLIVHSMAPKADNVADRKSSSPGTGCMAPLHYRLAPLPADGDRAGDDDHDDYL